jgi:hypothetical protein
LSESNHIDFKIPNDVTVVGEHHYKFASIRLRNDGITQIDTDDDAMFTLEETKEVHSKVTELNGEQPILILHVLGKHTSADDDSRKFLASKAGNQQRKAFAFVLQSLSQRIIANFYIKMNRPEKPTHFFNSQQEAEKWLRVMKKFKSTRE